MEIVRRLLSIHTGGLATCAQRKASKCKQLQIALIVPIANNVDTPIPDFMVRSPLNPHSLVFGNQTVTGHLKSRPFPTLKTDRVCNMTHSGFVGVCELSAAATNLHSQGGNPFAVSKSLPFILNHLKNRSDGTSL